MIEKFKSALHHNVTTVQKTSNSIDQNRVKNRVEVQK